MDLQKLEELAALISPGLILLAKIPIKKTLKAKQMQRLELQALISLDFSQHGLDLDIPQTCMDYFASAITTDPLAKSSSTKYFR